MKPLLKSVAAVVTSDVLAQVPEVAAHLVDREKKLLAERKRAVLALTNLSQEAEQGFPKLVSTVEAAQRARDEARAALLKAETALSVAVGERMAKTTGWMRGREELERSLIETCSPAIDVFIREMMDAMDSTMRTPPVTERSMVKNLNTGKSGVNAVVIGITPAQRLKAIRSAIDAAQALKLEADQSSVDAKLVSFRTAIPEIGASKGEIS